MGLFTQEDPIGIAGGLNLYGYANGDPINFSDPFGLKGEVACRGVKGMEDFAQHCALRVGGETFELLSPGLLRSQSIGPIADMSEYEGRWTTIEVPEGMTEAEFDAALLEQAGQLMESRQGDNYLPFGFINSNAWVFDAVTRAGGSVPYAAFARARALDGSLVAPGLCGGVGITTGSGCSGTPRLPETVTRLPSLRIW